MTKIERLRNLSDEELADEIAEFAETCFKLARQGMRFSRRIYKTFLLGWLHEEIVCNKREENRILTGMTTGNILLYQWQK